MDQAALYSHAEVGEAVIASVSVDDDEPLVVASQDLGYDSGRPVLAEVVVSVSLPSHQGGKDEYVPVHPVVC